MINSNLKNIMAALAWVIFTICRSNLQADAAEVNRTDKPTSHLQVEFKNPVYTGSMPDPSVIRYGDWYFAYGTTGKGRLKDGRIFKVLKSKDLVNWQEAGGALTPADLDSRFNYWAPEVVESDGKFYLYYSKGLTEDMKFELRVAVSDHPEGPFTDVAKLTDCENNRFTIDASPFRDSNGQWYLFYAKDFIESAPGEHPGTALVVDKLIGMTRLAGECATVARARYDWTLFEANRRMDMYGGTFDWHTLEGPCVVKHDGKYYCFYSGSNYQTAKYGVDYVVADKPMGPYGDQGDHARALASVPGKVRGPGHHCVVKGPDGKTDYFVYHSWDAKMKVRQMWIDELKWTPDGPRCVPTVTTATLVAGTSQNQKSNRYFISHRGEYMAMENGKGVVDAPEGTRPAFERVRDQRINAVKLDLQYTADHVVVISHDSNLKRTTGQDLPIEKTDYETLKKVPFLKVGGFEDERILTLDKALKIVKDCSLFYVDFKHHTPEMMTKTFETFEANGVPLHKVVIATFTIKALKHAQARYPKIRRVLHIDYGQKEDGSFQFNGKFPCADFQAVTEQLAELKKEMGLTGFNIPASSPFTTQEFIHQLKADGSWVSLWYIHSLEMANRFKDSEADGFVTGMPDAVRKAMRE